MIFYKPLFFLIIHLLAYRSVFTQKELKIFGWGSDIMDILFPVPVSCTNAKDCISEDFECVTGLCECRSGFVFDGTLTRCIKVATGFGSRCEESSQCSEFLSVGGVCQIGSCTCKDGYHYLHGRCYQSRRLGDSCETTEECYVNTDYRSISCSQGICQCSGKYYQREYRDCRRAAERAGGDCVIDSDCAYNEEARCEFQKCVDRNSTELLSSISITLESLHEIVDSSGNFHNIGDEPEAAMGPDCETDEDCRKKLKNSYCGVGDKCICDRAHFPSNDFQACIPEIGESCTAANEGARVALSICESGMWSCPIGMTSLKSNQQCRFLATSLGKDSCSRSEECQLFGPSASCEEHECRCSDDTHLVPDASFCWVSRKLGEPCGHDNDCHVRPSSPAAASCTGSNPEQLARVCTCPEGYVPATNNFACVSSQAGIGAACSHDSDCKRENSECSENGYCRCKERFASDPEGDFVECIYTALYHEMCYFNEQCSSALANTRCSNRTCECTSDYYYNTSVCLNKRWLDQECSDNSECFAQNTQAVCSDGICACDFHSLRVVYECWQVDRAVPTTCFQPWFILFAFLFLIFIIIL